MVQGQHRSDLFTRGYLELGKLLRNLSMSSRFKQRAHPNQTPVRPERTLRPIPTAKKVQWGKKVRKFHGEGLPHGFLARMQRAISTGARLVNLRVGPVTVSHIFILLPAMLLTMELWLRCTSAALACAAAVSTCNNRMKQGIIFTYF